ncbi:MAG: hypothetical protein CMJ33_09200 [Phycisphaerae bacterium]|nr:hypothetical protein [Phycisphaerae bacterium]
MSSGRSSQTSARSGRTSTDPPAWTSPIAWCTLVLVAAFGIGLDLWSKDWAFRNVAERPVVLDRDVILADSDWRPPPHQGMEVLPFGLLDFDLVMNHGAVFGIGQDQRTIFIAFTITAVTLAIMIFAFGTRARSHALHVGIALILAGGIGNLYDRILFGAVRDFLHMLPGWDLPFSLNWPNGSAGMFPWVFNVADMLLLLGMAIIVFMTGSQKGPVSRDGSGVEERDRIVDSENHLGG